jgi:pimeloyl-ACP methyl ester carboxylesterase
LIVISPPILRPPESKLLSNRLYARTFQRLGEAAKFKHIEPIAKGLEKLSSFEASGVNTWSYQRSINNVIVNGATWHDGKKLHIPTTIIHGSFDTLVYRPNLSALTKNRRIELIDTVAGHNVTGANRRKLVEVLTREMARM